MASFLVYQGNTYNIPIKLKINGEVISETDIKTVEFTFGKIRKVYPDEVQFKDGCFIVPLTQEDTFSLSEGADKYQTRVMFNDKNVKCTGTGSMTVRASLSREVLE